MKKSLVFVLLGIVEIIILTMIGLYFYRPKQHPVENVSVPTGIETDSAPAN